MSCPANNSDKTNTSSTVKKYSDLKSDASSSHVTTGTMPSKYFKDLQSQEMDYSEDYSRQIIEVKSRLSSSNQQIQNLPENKISELYRDLTGPQIYDVPSSFTSKNTVLNKIPEMFGVLPIVGKPKSKEPLNEYQENKIFDFLNIKLNADEFKNVIEYCSPENLKTGHELELPINMNFNSFTFDDLKNIAPQTDSQLFINRNYKMNLENDTVYAKHFKYRRVRLLPLPDREQTASSDSLEPGKDLLLQVKVYRPYPYNCAKLNRMRHSVCVCDIMVHGDQPLTTLRDHIACTNDLDMRVDVSDKLDNQPTTTAKEVFPSGFLFINNVFYVDTRPGCKDLSEIIRQWALDRGLGKFPRKDMSSVCFKDLVVRLGHPEVYMHQGKCEHLFTFSDIRLVSNHDSLNKSVYPFNTMVSSNQNAYCATCGEYCARWVVTDSNRAPFDPAYFCDICFKLYMYKDGKKVGNFKAYSFKGNDVHLFKQPS